MNRHLQCYYTAGSQLLDSYLFMDSRSLYLVAGSKSRSKSYRVLKSLISLQLRKSLALKSPTVCVFIGEKY